MPIISIINSDQLDYSIQGIQPVIRHVLHSIHNLQQAWLYKDDWKRLPTERLFQLTAK